MTARLCFALLCFALASPLVYLSFNRAFAPYHALSLSLPPLFLPPQDFYNLMNVYLDAVFFPRAVRDPQVMTQAATRSIDGVGWIDTVYRYCTISMYTSKYWGSG